MNDFNTKAARECLNILVRTKPHLYEDPRSLLPIWAEALDPDMPAGTAHELTVKAYADGVEFISPGDINSRWRAMKRDRLAVNPEPPDPPFEIANNPNAYAEYRKTYIHQIAWEIKPEIAETQALVNAKQRLQIGGR